MSIRASVLTPALAVMTVVALVGTGIALGQARQGEADATLVDAGQNFAEAGHTDETAAPQTTLVVDEPTTETTETTPGGSTHSTGSSAVTRVKATTLATTQPSPTTQASPGVEREAGDDSEDDEHVSEAEDDESEAEEYDD